MASRKAVYDIAHSEQSARSIVARWTRDEMGIDSVKELDEDERTVFDRMVAMIGSGSYDASWNGPHALWLNMIGRRPLYVDHDVGAGDYSLRSRARQWRDVL